MPKLVDPIWGKVRALRLPERDYVIFGSGPLVAHGVIDQIGDVDIGARGEAWKKALTLGSPTVAPKGDQVIALEGNSIEIYDGLFHFDLDEVIDHATVFEGLPFARLNDVVRYKEFLRREQDLQHLRMIRDHLLSQVSRTP